MELLVLAVAAFAVLIFLASKGRESDLKKGVQRADPSWGTRWLSVLGPLLLVVGILGALAFLSVDTSNPAIETHISDIPVTENNQQNLIIVCGIFAVVGAVLMLVNRK
jgi:hypothetical protein